MNKTTKKFTPAEAVRLAELIEYSDNSIVSSTVIKNKAGTITLFAFDKGQDLSEHTTPFNALIQVLDGEAEITIGGKKITTNAGETVLMPADIPHAVTAQKRFKMLLTMIRG